MHKRLTDISERKGKEKSMKIKKENANKYHMYAKKSNIGPICRTANGQRLSDVLVHKRLRGQIYIRLPSICSPKRIAEYVDFNWSLILLLTIVYVRRPIFVLYWDYQIPHVAPVYTICRVFLNFVTLFKLSCV